MILNSTGTLLKKKVNDNIKVVCINNDKYPELSLDKVYNAHLVFIDDDSLKPIEFSKNFIWIDDIMIWYDCKNFIELDEFRYKRINDILQENSDLPRKKFSENVEDE